MKCRIDLGVTKKRAEERGSAMNRRGIDLDAERVLVRFCFCFAGPGAPRETLGDIDDDDLIEGS